MGKEVTRPTHIRTARDYIRTLLHDRNLYINKQLAEWWKVVPQTAHRYMCRDRQPLAPFHIESVIEHLKLDPLDATRLRFLAARDAGWLLELKYIKLLSEQP